jgi:hypothetical protein
LSGVRDPSPCGSDDHNGLLQSASYVVTQQQTAKHNDGKPATKQVAKHKPATKQVTKQKQAAKHHDAKRDAKKSICSRQR